MVLDTLLLERPLGIGAYAASALSWDEQVSADAAEREEGHPENNNEET